MDSLDFSSGVIKFFHWLKTNGLIHGGMTGIDFSPTAIVEANTRSERFKLTNTHFLVHDAIQPWPFETGQFDIAIDCFGSTDIETPDWRKFVANEITRVLSSNGHLLVYTFILHTAKNTHSLTL